MLSRFQQDGAELAVDLSANYLNDAPKRYRAQAAVAIKVDELAAKGIALVHCRPKVAPARRSSRAVTICRGRDQRACLDPSDIDAEDHPAARAGDQQPRRTSGHGRRWARSPASIPPPPRDETIRGSAASRAQPPGIISLAPGTWSGARVGDGCSPCNAGYTNVHGLIPWRTLTGNQQFYGPPRGSLAFGEASRTTARRWTCQDDRADGGHQGPWCSTSSRRTRSGHPFDLHRPAC